VNPAVALTDDERAAIGRIVSRYPGLASAVHAHVTRLIQAAIPSADGAIATDAELDDLLGSVIERVVAGSARLRSDEPNELDEQVDAMVLLLARNSVARARPHLVERVARAKRD